MALLGSEGWSVGQALGAREAARLLVSPSIGLPVGSVNDAKTLIAAQKA